MSSSKPIRIFVLFFLFTSTFSACSWWSNLSSRSNGGQIPPPSQETQSELPFTSSEPENYQAEIILTNISFNEKSTEKVFIAKKGIQYFITFNVGEKSAVSNLKDADGISYIVFTEKKAYAENAVSSNSANISENELKDFISTEWLNDKPSVSFEKQPTENNLTVFKTNFKDGKNSEILIYFDETLKIPVRQEFYVVGDGDQKTLSFTAEIQNFVTAADEKYFRIPADYKKVSREEFDKIVQQGSKNE